MERGSKTAIHFSREQIFPNGSSSLTELGSKIQYIGFELRLLNQAWQGKIGVTAAKEAELVSNIAEAFCVVSDTLGINPDLSLVPDVLDEYDRIVAARKSSENNRASSEALA